MNDVPNWFVGLVIVTTAVFKILLGIDLISSQIGGAEWLRKLPRSWEFWMGNYFVLSALSFNGLVGLFLLGEPHDTVPVVFAFPILVSGLEVAIAWVLLSWDRRRRT